MCELFKSRYLVLFILLSTLISPLNFYMEYFTFILFSALFLILFLNVLNWNRTVSLIPPFPPPAPSSYPLKPSYYSPLSRILLLYTHTRMCLYKHMQIKSTKSVSVFCMYMVSGLSTWVDIQKGGSSLREANPPSPSSQYSSIVLCSGMGTGPLSP